MNQIAASVLLSASTLLNPVAPKALPFDASAYVTVNHQIRVAVAKTADVPVMILLRDKNNQVLFQRSINRKEQKYAVKLDVQELADGDYDLEVKSNEGSIRKQIHLATTPVQQTTRVVAMQH